jgi:hypothetical protein
MNTLEIAKVAGRHDMTSTKITLDGVIEIVITSPQSPYPQGIIEAGDVQLCSGTIRTANWIVSIKGGDKTGDTAIIRARDILVTSVGVDDSYASGRVVRKTQTALEIAREQ